MKEVLTEPLSHPAASLGHQQGAVQIRVPSESQKNIFESKNEKNLKEASVKERQSKDDKEDEQVEVVKEYVSPAEITPSLLSVTDLAGLSRSLEEFEREYAQMCSSPMMPCCQNGTLQDSSAALAIKASCSRDSAGGSTPFSSEGSFRSRKNSDRSNEGPAEKTDIICAKSPKGIGRSRSAGNSPKIPRRNVLHNERNISNNYKGKAVDDADISQRIEDLTKTVHDLQNSLSSLESMGLSDEEGHTQDSKGEPLKTSRKSLKEEKNVNCCRDNILSNELQRKDTQTREAKTGQGHLDKGQGQETTEILSAEVRDAWGSK